MGSGATSRWDLEYPVGTDTVNVPGDIETLANDLDALLFSLSITAKSANYAATLGQLVQMTGAYTVTSPAAASNVMWGVQNAGSGTAVTVVPASGVLNLPGNYGTSSLALTKQGDFAIFVCDGTNHNLIAGSADIMGLSVTAAAIEATFTAAGQVYVGTGSGTGEPLAKGASGSVLTVGGNDASGLEWAPGTSSVINQQIDFATLTTVLTGPTGGSILIVGGYISINTNNYVTLEVTTTDDHGAVTMYLNVISTVTGAMVQANGTETLFSAGAPYSIVPMTIRTASGAPVLKVATSANPSQAWLTAWMQAIETGT